MRDEHSVSANDRWFITERGKQALALAPRCLCKPHLAGLLIECPDCGTVYGSLRDSSGRVPLTFGKKL